MRKRPVAERFWEKVDKTAGPDACWIWLGSFAGRYGRLRGPNRVNVAAHRMAYELTHGNGSAAGYHVLHKCDNPPCCNPAHLVRGTHIENMQDMASKGRRKGRTGEAHPSHKLTATAVAAIRAGGESISRSAMARAYGVSRTAIRNVLKGKTWLDETATADGRATSALAEADMLAGRHLTRAEIEAAANVEALYAIALRRLAATRQ